MARDEHAGVTSGTEGEKGTELRPCDSVALTDLLGAREDLISVFRDLVDKRDAQIKGAQQRLEDVVAEYQKAGRSWDTTRARLTTERDDLRTRLAERDAQVGRLTKRLSEGLE